MKWVRAQHSLGTSFYSILFRLGFFSPQEVEVVKGITLQLGYRFFILFRM